MLHSHQSMMKGLVNRAAINNKRIRRIIKVSSNSTGTSRRIAGGCREM